MDTMTEVRLPDGFQLAKRWKWKTKNNEFLLPEEMRTSHLFYTLRMIWNNTCPPHTRVGNVRLYNFGPYYTHEYLKQAVGQLSFELRRRDDLHGELKDQMETMWAYFTKRLEDHHETQS